MFPSPAIRLELVLAAAVVGVGSLRADSNVVVSARADAGYTERKFGGAHVRPEGYVFGEGSFFGGITADRSLDRATFRQIAEALAPELARQQFWPAKDLGSADLLIVVHWGVTTPRQSMRDAQDVTALSFDPRDTPHADNVAADQLLREPEPSHDTEGRGDPSSADVAGALKSWEASPSVAVIERFEDGAMQAFGEASNAQLLGYTRALRRLDRAAFGTAEAETLRSDLMSERYLVILCAYDVKSPSPPGQKRRPIWVTHLNIRAAGTNFLTALNRMGQIGADFFGRTTDMPATVRAKLREGRATPGEMIILGTEEPTTSDQKPAQKR